MVKKKTQRVRFCFVCAHYWLFPHWYFALWFWFSVMYCYTESMLSKSHLCYCLGFLLHRVISDLVSEPQHTEPCGHTACSPPPLIWLTPLWPQLTLTLGRCLMNSSVGLAAETIIHLWQEVAKRCWSAQSAQSAHACKGLKYFNEWNLSKARTLSSLCNIEFQSVQLVLARAAAPPLALSGDSHRAALFKGWRVSSFFFFFIFLNFILFLNFT